MTEQDERTAIHEMTDKQLIAYSNILHMNSMMLYANPSSRIQDERHARFVAAELATRGILVKYS